MKKVIFTAIICAVTASAVVIIPDMMIKSLPTAKNVSVQKVEYTEKYELTGNIVKNVKDGSMYVKAYASEKEISKIAIGQTAEITVDAFPNCVYSGIFSHIADFASAKQIGNITKTVIEVRIDIVTPDDRLKPGYTANTAIILSEPEEMMLVPYEIINQDENGEYVYVLEENRAVKRYIETGAELSDGIEIISGIESSDSIINPDKTYNEGDMIMIVE